MSRIHDALKKAEEQVAQFGSAPQQQEEETPAKFPEIPLDVLAGFEVPLPEPAAVRVVAPVAPHESSLLQACRKVTWSPSKDALFLTSPDSHSEGMEEFRTLRAKLFQIRAKRPLKTILISSALPAEGKSFVSANLAMVFARQRGGRTLLIDADLRKPRLHEIFGSPTTPGLYEYLSGKASETDVIQRSTSDDLFFVPGGGVTSNAAELIGSPRMESFLEKVGPHFNWIIFDSSPVIPVSDPTRLAELTDGVLLVVRAGSTPYSVAERAKKEFHNSTMLGIVFNRVSVKENPYHRYSYGQYGPYGANRGPANKKP